MMDDHRLPRSNVPANECKALLFLDEIEQRPNCLLMAFTQEEELLIRIVLEGGEGETEVWIVHLKKPLN